MGRSTEARKRRSKDRSYFRTSIVRSDRNLPSPGAINSIAWTFQSARELLMRWTMTQSKDIRVRSFSFGVSVVGFARLESTRDVVLRRLVLQLVDAGTSIGANVEEAQAGQTKRDFIAKNCIALKEARESRYWLRLLIACEASLASRATALLNESSEIIAMLTAIIKTARSRP